jgi:hypothetical protein
MTFMWDISLSKKGIDGKYVLQIRGMITLAFDSKIYISRWKPS